jgi:hypothetical protein
MKKIIYVMVMMSFATIKTRAQVCTVRYETAFGQKEEIILKDGDEGVIYLENRKSEIEIKCKGFDDSKVLIEKVSIIDEKAITILIDPDLIFLKIITNSNGDQKDFATISISRIKPQVINIGPPIAVTDLPSCEPCSFDKDNGLFYDYRKNMIEKSENKPKVNKPFKFVIKNLNPFKDSVIIGQQTISFNTEVPELFNKLTKGFTPVGFNSIRDEGESYRIVDEVVSKLIAWRAKLKQIQQQFKDMDECYDICMIQQEIRKAMKKDFNQDKNILDYLNKLLGEDPTHKVVIEEVIQLYKLIVLVPTTIVYQIPQIENVDQYIFDITVLPKRDVQKSTILSHQPIRLNTKGGIKFDFSTGFFLTSLKSESFNLKSGDFQVINQNGDTTTEEGNQIIRQDEGSLDVGAAAFLHVYSRIGNSVNVSGTFGVGSTINKIPEVRYFLGGSLLYGNFGRLALTAGVCFGQSFQLAKGYSDREWVKADEISNIVIKKWKASPFLSFSYNIPIFNSSKEVGSVAIDDSDEEKGVDLKSKLGKEKEDE